jgi:uncharacterized phage protein gp47/JayE
MTRDEALQFILDQLAALGFQITAWQSGSPQRTLLLLFARVWADWQAAAKITTEFGYNELCTGDALTAYSLSRFDNTRIAAVKCVGPVLLTSTAAVPYTIAVGQLLVSTDIGVQYTNTTGGVLAAGGTLSLTFTAVFAGAGGVAANGTITRMITPLAGVTCSNPGAFGTPPVWYTTAGADAETDAALRLRNRTKFARQSIDPIRDAYVNIALNAHPSIRRVFVLDNNPGGAGTVWTYIAGATTALDSTGSEVQAAQNYFATRLLQCDSYPANPFTSRCTVVAASGLGIDIAGNIYYSASFAIADVKVAVAAALNAFLATVPIGGFTYPTSGVVPKNEIENAIRQATVGGTKVIKTVVLSVPASDIAISAIQVAVAGDWAGLSYSQV